jgi:hypothetical protein
MAAKRSTLLQALKRNWLHLVQFAAWATLALSFLKPPPGLHESPKDLAKIGIFAATVLTAFLVVLCVRWSKNSHKLYWATAAVALVLGGISSYLAYVEARAPCLCTIDKTVLLIGRELTAQAIIHSKRMQISSCDGLLREFAGVKTDIWTPASILECSRALLIWYVVSLLLLVAALISAAQTARLTLDRR